MSCPCTRCRVFEFLNTPAELWTLVMAWLCGIELDADEHDEEY